MRIPTVQLLTDWLKAHLHNLQHWTDPRTGRILDPFESHQRGVRVPAESYSPATSLVIAARACRQGHPQVAPLLAGYSRRIRDLMADEATPAFTALFLQHFGLMALTDLKAIAGQEDPPIPAEQVAAL